MAHLTIGPLAEPSGAASSALRFWESRPDPIDPGHQ
jgi:hypothetical protein